MNKFTKEEWEDIREAYKEHLADMHESRRTYAMLNDKAEPWFEKVMPIKEETYRKIKENAGRG